MSLPCPATKGPSERARRLTGHPLYKNERQALIQIAKTWPKLRVVQFGTMSEEQIYLAIMDARTSAASHLDAVGTNGCKASTETIDAHS